MPNDNYDPNGLMEWRPAQHSVWNWLYWLFIEQAARWERVGLEPEVAIVVQFILLFCTFLLGIIVIQATGSVTSSFFANLFAPVVNFANCVWRTIKASPQTVPRLIIAVAIFSRNAIVSTAHGTFELVKATLRACRILPALPIPPIPQLPRILADGSTTFLPGNLTTSVEFANLRVWFGWPLFLFRSYHGPLPVDRPRRTPGMTERTVLTRTVRYLGTLAAEHDLEAIEHEGYDEWTIGDSELCGLAQALGYLSNPIAVIRFRLHITKLISELALNPPNGVTIARQGDRSTFTGSRRNSTTLRFAPRTTLNVLA